jgi:hypothetical protein
LIDEKGYTEPTSDSHHRQPQRLDAQSSHGQEGFMHSGQ